MLSLKFVEGAPAPRISLARVACVAVICTVACTVFAAGKLERTRQATSEQSTGTAPPPGLVRILTPTQGVDFMPYTNHLLDSIKRNWYAHMPQEVRAGVQGQVVIHFTIQKNGKLARTIVESTSGNEQLDKAALSGVRASAPFDHLPEAFKGPNIELRVYFLYNLPRSAAKVP